MANKIYKLSSRLSVIRKRSKTSSCDGCYLHASNKCDMYVKKLPSCFVTSNDRKSITLYHYKRVTLNGKLVK